MLEESHVQSGSNGVFLVGIKHNLSTVVALMQRRQDVLGVITSISMSGYMACLGSRLARWKRLEWLMRLAGLRTRIPLSCWAHRSSLASHSQGEQKASGLHQGIGELHYFGKGYRRPRLSKDQVESRSSASLRKIDRAIAYIAAGPMQNLRHGETQAAHMSIDAKLLRWCGLGGVWRCAQSMSGETACWIVGKLGSEKGVYVESESFRRALGDWSFMF